MNLPMPQVRRSYSHESMIVLQEGFSMLDPSGEGYVDIDSVKDLFLSLNPNVDEKRMQKIFREAGAEHFEVMNFSQFFVVLTKFVDDITLCSLPSDDQCDYTDLSEVFLPLDERRTGYVSVEDFERLMTSKGGCFSSREMEAVRTKLANLRLIKNGVINYRLFVATMLENGADKSFI